jgi:DNA primase
LIPKETVDEIIETARVEEVVGEFVNLKKRGANLLGLCPFHNEKTPSFTVSPAKGIYKCFGCGKAGGAVNFMMDHEQYSYPEALRYLANKYNIEIEEEEKSPEEIQAANQKESLFIVNQFAKDTFIKTMIEDEEGRAVGLSYFKERGFRTETIEKFGLGYSKEGWSHFTDLALENGYNMEYLEKAGLTIVKEAEDGKSKRHFDRFRARVMFPIHNVSGRVIAFGGRTLKADKKTAKYLNSPESEIYNKSRVLYGLHLAKRKIVEQENCYLVEGYTDVISLHQQGIENVVASSGTSLTVEQIKLIKRYSPRITILYDGDEAGIKASFRGIDLILEEGLNVKVLAFSEGEDPDSFARNHSAEDLKSYLESEAVDFIAFKTKILVGETKNDPLKRAGMIRDIVNSIALIPDPITRSVYIQESSHLLEIEEETLMLELNKIRRNKLSKNIQQREDEQRAERSFEHLMLEKKIEKVDKIEYEEQDLIHTLIKFGNQEVTFQSGNEEEEERHRVSDYLIEEILHDNIHFKDPLFRKVFELFVQAKQNEQELLEKDLISNPDQEVAVLSIDLLLDKYQLSVNWEEKHKILTISEEEELPKKIHKGICSWRLKQVIKMIREEQEGLKENPDDYEERLAAIRRLEEAKKQLAGELGRIVLPK